MTCSVFRAIHRFVLVPAISCAGDGTDKSQRTLLSEILPRITLNDRNRYQEVIDGDATLGIDIGTAAAVVHHTLHHRADKHFKRDRSSFLIAHSDEQLAQGQVSRFHNTIFHLRGHGLVDRGSIDGSQNQGMVDRDIGIKPCVHV